MSSTADRATRKLLVVTRRRLDFWIAPRWFSERLAGEFPAFTVAQRNSCDGVDEDIADVEVMFAPSLTAPQFLAAKKLRWIHSQSAAVHQFMFRELVASDVLLTNSREVHAPVVAEHVMAMIFALAKKIPAATRFQQERVWGQEAIWRLRPRDLAGRTLGLVGLGSIGRKVAKNASSLGMRVIAVRERPERERPEGVSEVLPSSKLAELLSESDYVVLSVPLTPQTTGLIGRRELAAMKADASLINVGRGPLVDEAALADALGQQKIGGAALDVFDKEPLPADSPLWKLDNLLITPHTAGMSEEMWERHYSLFRENLGRYLSGEPLLGLVNKQRGY
ncbi:MAG: D-2-hydroxyacid dehydrogenase [Acidobacteria bacterium]|nr:D-2-hydroxyacid dehydrogenase [Acidobacteriota bacterium]